MVDEGALRAAVTASRSWRGLARALGGTHSAAALRACCDRLEIDYTHFRTRTWTDAQLVEVLAESSDWNAVVSALGYAPGSGSARSTVRKHAARLGLDTTGLDVRERVPPVRYDTPADLRHLRAAGAFLVAGACALRGMRVSWPLEPAPYDLVVDVGSELHRVQVKTTTWRLDGAWACKITHRSRGESTCYTKADIDSFGVVDGDQRVFMIPVEVVTGLGTIVVRHYETFRLR